MLEYMLDTNICMYVIKTRPAALRERFDQLAEALCISVITLSELLAGHAVAGLGEAAAFDAGTARMLRGHQPEIGHQLARIGKAREVAQFGDQGCCIDQSHAAHCLQCRHHRANVQSGSIASLCAVSPL